MRTSFYTSRGKKEWRIVFFESFLFLLGFTILVRLFFLQVIGYNHFTSLALNQYELFRNLLARRGEIFFSTMHGKHEVKGVALNRDYGFLYANPSLLINDEMRHNVLSTLMEIFPELENRRDELWSRFSKTDDPFEPILHKVPSEKERLLKEKHLPGIFFDKETLRYYPEGNIGSHILGFVSFREEKQKGQYGLENFFNEELSGKDGSIQSERSVGGVLIPFSSPKIEGVENGANLFLTIDPLLEYFSCKALADTVLKHGAKSGTVIILQPQTGKILALCNFPDFDPNNYESIKDLNMFNNNAIFSAYEPGSVMKTLTLAAAMDQGKITPDTTYVDTGSRKYGKFTIRNAQDKVYGLQTMTSVLKNSINTGAIFSAESIGKEQFQNYLHAFGFGETSGIELTGEVSGDLSSLTAGGDIYLATASFGQGITATPLQLISAYGALANGGKLMKPYIVEKIEFPNNEIIKASPKELRQVVSPRVATLISGMLVEVVEDGHSKRAKVPGFYLGAKTGTAQVPDPEHGGYSNRTIHTVVGYGPVNNARFAMLTRIDESKDVQFAEGDAAPLFGQIAEFLLHYLEVPPDYETND